jgi:hypothetical protein
MFTIKNTELKGGHEIQIVNATNVFDALHFCLKHVRSHAFDTSQFFTEAPLRTNAFRARAFQNSSCFYSRQKFRQQEVPTVFKLT